MAPSYAPRPLWIAAEADLGAVFCQVPVRPDGSPGAARYWDHDAGRWTPGYSPARHVRRLTRPLAVVARSAQALAVPLAVATDPAATVIAFHLDGDGSPRSVAAIVGATELAAAATSTVAIAT